MNNLLFFPSMVKPIEECPNRIREWRERRNRMSMAVLAGFTGISQQHLSRIETGKKSPSLDQLERIARALDVSVGELLHVRHNPYLPTPRQRALLEKLDDEQSMRTAEAVAEAQRSFNGPIPDPVPPDIAPAPSPDEPPGAADQVA